MIVLILVAGLAGDDFARAQPTSRRVPIISGNGMVQVLVEVDGTVKTWGYPTIMDPNISLGDGVKPSASKGAAMPRALPGLTDIVDARAAISHVLLLRRDGTVLAWGDNDDGQLGTGIDKTMNAPVPVPGLTHVKQIAVSESVSGAVLEDGSVWTWGAVKRPSLSRPTKVDGLSDVSRLSLDGPSGLAVKRDGTVWGWGSNKQGELCNGTKNAQPAPAPIAGITNAVDANLDGNSIVVLADGTVRMCGDNIEGALADAPSVREHLTPFKVPGLAGVVAATMRTGGGPRFVRLSNGTLLGWGMGMHGALGDGQGDSTSWKPRSPIGLGPVIAHYMSGLTSYAIRADGTVMNWCLPAPPGEKTEFVLTPRAAGFTVKVSQ